MHGRQHCSPSILLQKLTEWFKTQSRGWREGLSYLSDADRHTGVFVQKHCKPLRFLQASIQQG